MNSRALMGAPISVGSSTSVMQAPSMERTLNVQADDGFVAYLNGVEVASANVPDPVAWNSTSSGSTSDGNVVAGRQIDLAAHLDAFRNGTNVLAIHAMNSSLNGSDFLIRAGLDINETVAASPLLLNESQVVIARVRDGDFLGSSNSQPIRGGHHASEQ